MFTQGKIFAFIFLCIIFHFTPVARCRVRSVHSKCLHVIRVGRWRNYHATVLELSCLCGKIYPAQTGSLFVPSRKACE